MGMLNLQKLRYLSSICAYCNKVIPQAQRTNDHIIPQCAGGSSELHNIVICCQDCNCQKGAMEVNAFLEAHPEKAECFYNYLNMIDYQCGNDEYSKAIVQNLSDSLQNKYFKKKAKKRAKRQRYKQNKINRGEFLTYNEEQNIEYKSVINGKSFYLNELQSKILDYYLTHSDFTQHKELAKELGISNERISREICSINNLTGIFKLKKVSENGIMLNDLFFEDIGTQVVKRVEE